MPEDAHDAQGLSELLGGTLEGANRRVKRLSTLAAAEDDSVCVVAAKEALDAVPGVVVAAQAVTLSAESVIRVADTRLALAKLSEVFDERPPVAEGVHPSAQVHPEAQLAENVHLAANVVVGAGARIERGTRVGAGCAIGARVRIGEGCLLHANVTLYGGVTLGKRVTLHSGAVIGSDGFGYAASERGAYKIQHLGSVTLEDDVEIGANTCVDRGTLDDTRIGARSKIDNLCQIGHNVVIGTDCLIAGTVGIAGSTTLGNRVTMGGSSGAGDHLHIGDDVRVAARGGVTKDVPAGETWAGFPAQPYKRWVRGLYLQRQLETLWQAFKRGPT